MNIKIGPLAKEHTWYPWDFQQTVGRPNHQQLRIVSEELQHMLNSDFRVLERRIRVVFNEVIMG
jgi:hypothetical protein